MQSDGLARGRKERRIRPTGNMFAVSELVREPFRGREWFGLDIDPVSDRLKERVHNVLIMALLISEQEIKMAR